MQLLNLAIAGFGLAVAIDQRGTFHIMGYLDGQVGKGRHGLDHFP